jgi:hypothetical protein
VKQVGAHSARGRSALEWHGHGGGGKHAYRQHTCTSQVMHQSQVKCKQRILKKKISYAVKVQGIGRWSIKSVAHGSPVGSVAVIDA